MIVRIEGSDSLQGTPSFVNSICRLKNLSKIKAVAKQNFLSNKFLLISAAYLNLTLASTAWISLSPRGIISEKVAFAWHTSALLLILTIFSGEYLCKPKATASSLSTIPRA